MDPRVNEDLREVFQAVESVAALAYNFERVANTPVPADANSTARGRAARQAMVRISAGATTGATIAALGAHDRKALVTGAVIGGIAGFIYDRAMNGPTVQPPALPACPAQQP